MEITGRITADAIVKNLTDGRQLVSFDIALNDYFRTRAGEKKQVATFYDCTYWISTKIAPYLTKGSIVSVYGHASVYAYKDKDGNPQAALQFHVNNIRFVSQVRNEAKPAPQQAGTPVPQAVNDLPF